jgi:Flp pilus assembly protein TadD
MQFGEYENAAQACRNSLALSPDEEKAHFLLGVSQAQLGDHRSALGEYKALRRLGSPYADRLLEHLQGSGVAAPLT